MERVFLPPRDRMERVSHVEHYCESNQELDRDNDIPPSHK